MGFGLGLVQGTAVFVIISYEVLDSHSRPNVATFFYRNSGDRIRPEHGPNGEVRVLQLPAKIPVGRVQPGDEDRKRVFPLHCGTAGKCCWRVQHSPTTRSVCSRFPAFYFYSKCVSRFSAKIKWYGPKYHLEIASVSITVS